MPKDTTPKSADQEQFSSALLHEMTRSFVTLAKTLNLTHAVAELGSSRQTVRRHIAQLEKLRGVPLFEMVNRKYVLTLEGKTALPEAEKLVHHSMAWATGQSGTVAGLQYLKTFKGNWGFYQQEQPMGSLWNGESTLLRETLRGWVMSSGLIEHGCLAHVRPHMVVYRDTEMGWISVEFGRKSAYVGWFGLDYARSSVGRPVGKLPAGEEFGYLLNQAFDDIQSNQLCRLDHVFTYMPQPKTDTLVPIAYQRLMMAGFFPDGSPAVLTVVEPTSKVNIQGLSQDIQDKLVEIEAGDFDPENGFLEMMHEEWTSL